MYYVTKRLEISAAHRLTLDYESKCTSLHGHNWIITVHCRAEELNANGMVVDFTDIKRTVLDRLDHRCLNDVLPFNPTAENIARPGLRSDRTLLPRGRAGKRRKHRKL